MAEGVAHPGAPLHGVRVVDLTTVLSGPLATAVLADQGADVIKVERPGVGDLTRSIGSRRNGVTAMFAVANRGKRSIALDLASDTGRDTLLELIATADVLIENFRPGVADRLGLGYDHVSAVRPAIVYLSIAGFGFEGPLASTKVYDNLIQAASGLAAQQAEDGGPPRFIRNLVCDKITASIAAQAVTAALLARANGAGGQHIEVSMLDAAISFLWPDAGTQQTFTGPDVQRVRSTGADGLTAHTDGWTTSAPVTDEEFRSLCRAYGLEHLADDPHLTTLQQRMANPEHYRQARVQLEQAAAQISTAEALERLTAAGVPAAAAVEIDELASQPQVLANDTFAAGEHPAGGTMIQPRPPVRFARTPADPSFTSPGLGEHTDEILSSLGYDEARIAALRDAGVVQ